MQFAHLSSIFHGMGKNILQIFQVILAKFRENKDKYINIVSGTIRTYDLRIMSRLFYHYAAGQEHEIREY
jgi:hypothetical protein